ncbi:hemerythrin domain-containing protein, partial [Streptomyces lydicus]|uniref:hemerythrin domain-containing protein n=1 Tax=Streptomyces lydicus TaxID=47763 RepID=UPI0036BBA753
CPLAARAPPRGAPGAGGGGGGARFTPGGGGGGRGAAAPGGGAAPLLADSEIADHQRVERLLKELEGRDAEDADFDRLVRELRTEVTAHVRDEEDNLFPQLRDGVHSFVLESLGRKVREAKEQAPTRPHPQAPSTPPANKLLAPGLGLVDRVRDYVTGRGRRPEPPGAG